MKEQTRKRAKEKVEEMYRCRDSHLHMLRKSRMSPELEAVVYMQRTHQVGRTKQYKNITDLR